MLHGRCDFAAARMALSPVLPLRHGLPPPRVSGSARTVYGMAHKYTGDAIDGPGIRSLLNLRWQRSIPVAFSVAYLRQAQGVKGLSAVKTEVALFHGICQQWLCYSLYSPP